MSNGGVVVLVESIRGWWVRREVRNSSSSSSHSIVDNVATAGIRRVVVVVDESATRYDVTRGDKLVAVVIMWRSWEEEAIAGVIVIFLVLVPVVATPTPRLERLAIYRLMLGKITRFIRGGEDCGDWCS